MDDGFGCFVYIMLIGMGVMLVLGILYTILVILLKAFAWIVLIAAIMLFFGIIAGLAVGAITPVRVFWGVATSNLVILSPDMVVAGKAFNKKQTGENEEYGWDWAWPTYIPYQAKHDIESVRLQYIWVWRKTADNLLIGRVNAPSSSNKRTISNSPKDPLLYWRIFMSVPYIGFWMGLVATFLAWIVVYGTFFLAGAAFMIAMRMLLAVTERLSRKLRHAQAYCPECYHISTMPTYECSNSECKTYHNNIRPGPLGLRQRKCGCGTILPNTVTAAAKKLEAYCPACQYPLSEGAGGHSSLILPVIGASNAGKTMFLGSALAALEKYANANQGELEPRDLEAKSLLLRAKDRLEQGNHTAPTDREQPVGRNFLLSGIVKRPIHIQIMDVAGEYFSKISPVNKLQYFYTAEHYILVVDPLSNPDLLASRNRVIKELPAQVTVDDQRDKYGNFSTAIRNAGISLNKKSLTVVISRGDEVSAIPEEQGMASMTSAELRQWLHDHGHHLLINAIDVDFPNAKYCVVDSFNSSDFRNHLNPLHVLLSILVENGLFDKRKLLSSIVEAEHKAAAKEAARQQKQAVREQKADKATAG